MTEKLGSFKNQIYAIENTQRASQSSPGLTEPSKPESIRVMEDIRQKIRQLLEERQEDVKMISEMVH